LGNAHKQPRPRLVAADARDQHDRLGLNCGIAACTSLSAPVPSAHRVCPGGAVLLTDPDPKAPLRTSNRLSGWPLHAAIGKQAQQYNREAYALSHFLGRQVIPLGLKMLKVNFAKATATSVEGLMLEGAPRHFAIGHWGMAINAHRH